MVPRAPLSNSSHAEAASSASMTPWCVRLAQRPQTVRTRPASHCIMSMLWMAWLIRRAPPSSAHVPRQEALL